MIVVLVKGFSQVTLGKVSAVFCIAGDEKGYNAV